MLFFKSRQEGSMISKQFVNLAFVACFVLEVSTALYIRLHVWEPSWGLFTAQDYFPTDFWISNLLFPCKILLTYHSLYWCIWHYRFSEQSSDDFLRYQNCSIKRSNFCWIKYTQSTFLQCYCNSIVMCSAFIWINLRPPQLSLSLLASPVLALIRTSSGALLSLFSLH